MLNYLWLGLLLVAVVVGGSQGRLQQVTDAAFDAAKTSVMSIALPLVGITALWLGLMRLAEQAGLIRAIANALRPVMRHLFPDVPPDHPAMGSMLMNMAANVLGLANAATPLGLRAMSDLQKLNPTPCTATNAMCTFLALNTSSLQLIPATAIGILAAAGAANPTAIVGTTIIATFCSTAVGLIAVKAFERMPGFRLTSQPHKNSVTTTSDTAPSEPDIQSSREARAPWHLWQVAIVTAFVLVFGVFFAMEMNRPDSGDAQGWFIRCMNAVSVLAIPFLVGLFPLCAAIRRVRVYEEFVTGAREGFEIAIRVIPYLVAMLVAVGTFRAAGGVDILGRALSPVLEMLRLPVDLLPMALTRPLSGSATIGLFAELTKALGPDHIVTRMGGTLLGSTETTFYVVAVYFGSVSVRRVRHALLAGLLADLGGIIASVVVCRAVFGSHL